MGTEERVNIPDLKLPRNVIYPVVCCLCSRVRKHGIKLISRLHLLTTDIYFYMLLNRPPLWSSSQSSWLQIRRPGFDSRHYQEKKVVGLERGPLSLVSTTEELLDRKVAAPV
jgi:hypothetical protein